MCVIESLESKGKRTNRLVSQETQGMERDERKYRETKGAGAIERETETRKKKHVEGMYSVLRTMGGCDSVKRRGVNNWH